ncbi:MAG: bifunctional DNA primase/polymerase [Oscillospiraceae bacterium]|nr:bifunctional DNA primase/polymerase [Oscillospiraceae bacterium]
MSYSDKLRGYAQSCARFGLRVFPCKPKGKAPATAHGCKDASADPGQIAAWWDGTYLYNVAIATGGGIVVLDVDVNHNAGKYGDETLAELEQLHGPLPETWTCLTGGGGIHYYFRCDDPALTVGTGFAPGLDYRGAGGYVIAPPSTHESGREYVWEAAHTPGNTELAPLPEWLHTLMLNGVKTVSEGRGEAPAQIAEGGRNDTLYRLACSLRSKGMSEMGITAALLEENRARCVPPLPDREVEKITASAGKHPPGDAPDGGAPAPPKEARPLSTISAPELQQADLPPVKYLVEGMLPDGTGLLTAASKIGKSWMVLDLGLCVAAGRPFLGRCTHQAGVLYLALEDSLNRLQDRMNKVLNGKPAPPQFYFSTEAPKLDMGLLDTLDSHLKKSPDTRLIIIDTLQKVRGQALPRESGYAQDYREMETIKAFMDKRGVSVLFVHHNRKMRDDDDPFNMISGTNGIMGAADTIWTIAKAKRADEEAVLHITGRDVPQSSLVIRFDKGEWTWKPLGAADWLAEQRARLAYDGSPIVKTIKKLLDQSPGRRWDGTAKELMEAGKYIARTYLAVNTQKMGHEIKALEKPLFDYDGIVHAVSSHGSSSKKHHFYYQDIDGFEELEGDQTELPEEFQEDTDE